MTSAIPDDAMRSHWFTLGLACTVAARFTMWTAWRDMYVASSGERLLRIGLMIAFRPRR